MKKKDFSEKRFMLLIRNTLRAGVAAAVFLFLAGFALKTAGSGASRFFLEAGVLAVIATPVCRVMMLVWGFFKTREYWLAAAAFVVLLFLSAAMLPPGR